MPNPGRPKKSTLTVTYYKRKGRQGFTLSWRDPIADKPRTQKSESLTEDDVKREAARLELKLRMEAGQSRVSWEHFVEAARRDYIPPLAKATKTIARRVIDTWLAANGNMPDMSTISPLEISRFRAEAKKHNPKRKPVGDDKSIETIGKDLRSLKSLLNWGKSEGFIREIPKIKMPPRRRGFLGKGRPIPEKTYLRLREEIAKEVGPEYAGGWLTALDGMWHSAVRIGELLALTFDRVQILESGAVVIEWQPEDQKSRRAETTPTTPEFAALIHALPYRDGKVFRPMLWRSWGVVHQDTFSHKMNDACGRLGVSVTNHDLRRSFADRWARKVTPLVLSRLMRCGVEVIQDYYAELESESTSLELIETFGSGNSRETVPYRQRKKKAQ